MRGLQKNLFRMVPVLGLIALWELASRLGWLNAFIMPAPSVIFLSAYEMTLSGQLVADVWQSLTRVFVGFFLSVLIATPLGFLTALNKKADFFLGPLIHFIRPIPPIAWIPLAILWFGIGNGPSFFLTMVASFFPIVINTHFGVKSLSAQHLRVAQCFEASPALTFRRVIFPAALPFMLSGFRIGLGVAWMAVVAAEMIASHSGLGYLIHVSQDLLKTDKVIVGMVVIGIIGLVFDALMKRLELKLVPWGRHS